MADERQKPVVNSDDISVKKRSKAENFFSNFVSDLIVNVLFPSVERMASGIVSDTFDATKRAILSAMKVDSTTTSSQKTINGNPTRISYNDYYNRFNGGGPSSFTPVVDDYPYNEVTFDTRPKAELVLARLREVCRLNKVATVGDYYDLCRIPTAPTDFNFGWLSLDSATIRMHPKGYRIKLPRAMPIDR